jgi:small GTP-binding protein
MHAKVVLLGNSGVGKTALVERVTEDIFQHSHIPTVGAQFVSLELEIGGKPCILDLWDTAGQEVFRSLVGFYARDAKGAFLLFDVTATNSFEALPQWLDFLQQNAPDAKVIIFGNKTDLANREIASDAAAGFAGRNHALYFEGSAKTGENVGDAFDRMTEILTTGEGAPVPAVDIKGGNKKTKKGCC